MRAAASHFVPSGAFSGKHSTVGDTYVPYAAWAATGSVFGSASFVLSMQALLYAVGLGSETAVPLAAAVNWVLKDGLGQLGGIVAASKINTRFDADPRRWRMVSALAINGAIVLEAASPFAPGMFLAIASSANVAKNVGWLCASASKASVHKSFAKTNNLADITAKAGAQSIAGSVVGTALGIAISGVVEPSSAAMVATVALLCGINTMCINRALKNVVVPSLSTKRAGAALLSALHVTKGSGGISVDIDEDAVLSPKQVALAEANDPLFRADSRIPDITIGIPASDFFADGRNGVLCFQKYWINFASPLRPHVLLMKDAKDADVFESLVVCLCASKLPQSVTVTPDMLASALSTERCSRLLEALERAGWDVSSSESFLENRRLRIIRPN